MCAKENQKIALKSTLPFRILSTLPFSPLFLFFVLQGTLRRDFPFCDRCRRGRRRHHQHAAGFFPFSTHRRCRGSSSSSYSRREIRPPLGSTKVETLKQSSTAARAFLLVGVQLLSNLPLFGFEFAKGLLFLVDDVFEGRGAFATPL